MNDFMTTFSGGTVFIIYPLLVFLVIFLLVLWIFMPFAVFGLKPRIDDAVNELRQIRAELATLNKQLRDSAGHNVTPDQDTDTEKNSQA